MVFLTDRGRVRSHNEDNGGVFVNKDGTMLAVVCDGMGGHQAGEVASEKAVSHIKEMWEETTNISSPEPAEIWLKTFILQTNQSLFDHANSHEECHGMGTTIVAVILGDSFVTLAHVGDSRIYLISEEGAKQLTEDHTFVNELVKTGQISKEDAEHHPRKNVILQALGTEKTVKIDIKTITYDDPGYILLCSDGLTDKVNDREIVEVLNNGSQALSAKAEELIRRANHYGGEDNITVAILELSVSEAGSG
ncbi:Stp1/IreP family PP2C-type Ser/Thr phosphatase [Sutcliffiella horikoshii]|uniref:Stp1/IreP family PP2C-type Ser/Thr phosphatase n=1 Tax=Sutcliffiella horikoshii TaxID=79883 RepID=UPI001EEF2EA8|nr:Stp1/IreP family PP2C-type Ser/Thr phosphatase [Sutcliffiella horikoshii]MCG1020601.1 Stp1/IreP family PP2C-type Ser/Thr phosphatase [Sutcliffiella horikoshii]